MGDFERTFGAGADAADVVDALSRGRTPPRPGARSTDAGLQFPSERQERELARTTAAALSGSMNRMTLIGVVTRPAVVERQGIIDVRFEMATWEGDSRRVTLHSVSVDDDRLFDVVETELLPGTRVYVEGTLRRIAAVASTVRPEHAFVIVRKEGGRLVALDRPGLETIPGYPWQAGGTISF